MCLILSHFVTELLLFSFFTGYIFVDDYQPLISINYQDFSAVYFTFFSMINLVLSFIMVMYAESSYDSGDKNLYEGVDKQLIVYLTLKFPFLTLHTVLFFMYVLNFYGTS